MYSRHKEIAKTNSFRLGVLFLALICVISGGKARAEQGPPTTLSQADKANATQADSQTQDRSDEDSDSTSSQQSPVDSYAVITSRNQQGSISQARTSGVKELQAGSKRSVRPFRMQLAAAPTSIAFGIVNLGSSSAQTLILSNSGTAPLNITQIGVSGTGYSIENTPFPIYLKAGGKTTINVSFTPKAAGSVSGQLAIASCATNSSVTVAMTAVGASTGSAPVITTEPVNIGSQFGSRTNG